MATTQQLTVTATYGSGSTSDVTASAAYSSSDELVATVDTAGLITAVGAGSATVTATFDGSSSSCAVTVTDTVQGLSVEPTTADLDPGA
ncbi:Ig-like domain-containing protein [Nocardiopsis sp. NPDC049922]|uniref:Ig-like domain-containing protein n=1 Tax=Nocardiopsis sp. NPDC049922 TaxID=3155157 RepID=UPI0033FE7F04